MENSFKGILPQPVENFIEEMVEKGEMNREFLYSSFLAIASGLIGNRVRTKVKEGWIQNCAIWMVLVGNSGVKKSPTVKALLSPVYEMEAESHKQYKQELAKYIEAKNSDEKGIKHPKCSQILVDDITIEALNGVMEDNPLGLFQYKDEFITLFSDAAKSKSSNQEGYLLSIYDSKPVRINRKTDKENRFAYNVFLAILGGVQMPILQDVANSERVANGFMSRVLFCVPENISYSITDLEPSKEIIDAYNSFIESFQKSLPNNIDSCITLEMKKAMPLYNEWRTEFIKPKIDSITTSDFEKSSVSKFEATCIKLATIIEVLTSVYSGSLPTELSEDSILAATILIDYYYEGFKQVESNSLNKLPVVKPKEVAVRKRYIELIHQEIPKKEAVKQLLEEGFKNADIHRALGIAKATISGYK